MFKLGIVTYQIAENWNLDALLEKLIGLELEGVELRTGHAHGVESNLSKQARAEVKRKFADTPVKLVGLGSAFDYHTPDQEELKQTIEATKEYVLLAKDVGAEGVKVRPNAFPPEIQREQTIEQIGKSLREIGEFAGENGVKIRLEVHGPETGHPPFIRQMLDIAGHSNVYACWNSNQTDMDETGSIDGNFNLLKDKIELVHIHHLPSKLWDYPYKRLFFLLKDAGYDGFCLAEISASSDPDTVLLYYRELFFELSGSASRPTGE